MFLHSGTQVHRVAPIWDIGVLVTDRRQTIVLSLYGSESIYLEVAIVIYTHISLFKTSSMATPDFYKIGIYNAPSGMGDKKIKQ